MFKRKDVMIIALAVCLALAAFGISALQSAGKRASNVVHIYVDGKLARTATVGSPQEIVLSQENGEENVIAITENGAYMLSSTCKNQLCVDQGEITKENYGKRALGNHIICLPNRVTVELVLEQDDIDLDAPDV